ncbi:MAG: zinc metallopeptidase [Thermotogaceae bacterium]|nr:zinc metallopeptidase [Thermotogaceae bacterium]
MLFYDPTFILLIPAVILAFWAQIKVSTTYAQYSKIKSTTNLTGSQLAMRLMEISGIYNVSIETIPGQLTDHYDPKNKVVRLSSSTHGSSSIAALGIVAHEIGHAVQDKEKYPLLAFRSVLAPVASIGSSMAWILFLIGLLFFSPVLIKFGVVLFSVAVLFTLVTLPVEFNASRRAVTLLENHIMMPHDEVQGVKKVLSAAALTYVAATSMAILQLLRMLLIAGAFGNRR